MEGDIWREWEIYGSREREGDISRNMERDMEVWRGREMEGVGDKWM